VEAAGVVTNLPLTPASWGGDLRIDGRPDVNAAPALIDWEVAGPGYFAAAGIDVLDGRAFESQDRAGAPLVAIVNESLASRWFPAGAIGERISGEGDGTPWRTIVGVVSDVRQQSLRQDEARPQMYIADGQSFPWPERKLVVAVQGSNPLAAVAAIRAAVTAAAPELAIDRVDPLDALVTASAASARFQTTLLGIFAVIALVLGLAGVFGVVSDSVERRTHEIAIRKALGATDRRVLFGELVRGVTPVAAGVVAGATVALAGAQIAASRVHDLAPPDALTFAAIAVTLLLVSAGAIAIPATRASRRDPGGAMSWG
jgi:putative ABC transport system permease protein